MALSRSMKNLMHQSAVARGGGGNPTGGGRSGFIGRAMQQAKSRGQPTRDPVVAGGGQQNLMKAKMQRLQQRGGMPRGGVMGGPRGGVMGGPAGGVRPAVQPPQRGPGTVAGKPMPRGGTFGFASRGGGGTPTLQEATAGARSQVMRQAAARPTGLPGAMSGAQQQAAMQRSRAAGPAALAKPRGQSVAARIGGQQGPPARRGGMARALGSGGSRRRMLR